MILIPFFLGTKIFAQDSIELIGTVDNAFFLSSTHKTNPELKEQFEKQILLTQKYKVEFLNFINESNKDNYKKARKQLKSKEIKNYNEFQINTLVALLRLKELNILYLPTFQVIDENEHNFNEKKIISCTPEQLEKIIDPYKKFKFKCKYLGEFYVDNAKCYQLIDFEETTN